MELSKHRCVLCVSVLRCFPITVLLLLKTYTTLLILLTMALVFILYGA